MKQKKKKIFISPSNWNVVFFHWFILVMSFSFSIPFWKTYIFLSRWKYFPLMFLVHKLSKERRHETLLDFVQNSGSPTTSSQGNESTPAEWLGFFRMFFKRANDVFFPVEKAPEKTSWKMMVKPLGKVFFWLFVVVPKFREQRCGLKVHSTKKRNSKYSWECSVKHFESARGQTPSIPAFVDWYPSSQQFLYSHKFYETNFQWHLEFHQISGGRSVNPIRSKAYLQRTPHGPPHHFSQFLWVKSSISKRENRSVPSFLASKQWGQISMAEMKQNHLQPHVSG